MQQNPDGATKKCPHCQRDISIMASRCPHCQGDLRNWFARNKVLSIIVVVILLGIWGTISNNETQTPLPQTNTTSNTSPSVSTEPQQPTKTPSSHTTIKQQAQPPQTTPPQPSQTTTGTPASVQPTPPPPQAAWHSVATFSGSGDTNTDAFTIRGSKWRIDWSFSFPPDTTSYCVQNGCNMGVQIYQDDGSLADQFLENGQQPSSGTVYEYAKTGNFYMHVIHGNVSWNLVVQDYY